MPVTPGHGAGQRVDLGVLLFLSLPSLPHLCALSFFFLFRLNITYIGFELNSLYSSGSIRFRLLCQQEVIDENEMFSADGLLGNSSSLISCFGVLRTILNRFLFSIFSLNIVLV